MPKTVVGLFENARIVDDAVREIEALGFPRQEVLIMREPANFEVTGVMSFPLGRFRILHETQCTVWTGAPIEHAPAGEFSIRRILCSVDLTPHDRHTLTRAAEMAAAVDATLTLAHITPSVESFGPSGSHINAEWKKTIVGIVATEIAELQQAVGTKAEVIIDSGNIPQLLNRAAEQIKADVLVIGHIPGRSHLGDNGEGYGIIRQSTIPVLSV